MKNLPSAERFMEEKQRRLKERPQLSNPDDDIGLDVDDRRLFEEWGRQRTLRYHWGKKWADAKRDHRLAEVRVEVVGAELDKQIRKDPVSYGLEKITEPAIERITSLDEGYRKAVRREIDAEHAVNVFRAVVESINDRKAELENKVQMMLGGLYADPKLPKQVNDKFEKAKTEHAFSRSVKNDS